jgi:hypothetical protein
LQGSLEHTLKQLVRIMRLKFVQTMLGALNELVVTYPHLYKKSCCAHILDLLFDDWGKDKMFKTLITRAK